MNHRHLLPNRVNFMCDMCTKKYKRKSYFDNHILHCDGGVKNPKSTRRRNMEEYLTDFYEYVFPTFKVETLWLGIR